MLILKINKKDILLLSLQVVDHLMLLLFLLDGIDKAKGSSRIDVNVGRYKLKPIILSVAVLLNSIF